MFIMLMMLIVFPQVGPGEDVLLVREEQGVGSEVTRVVATDPDNGANGTLTYSLVNGKSAMSFLQAPFPHMLVGPSSSVPLILFPPPCVFFRLWNGRQVCELEIADGAFKSLH